MGSFKFYATVAGCLAVASSVGAARAADLLGPPPPPPMEPYVSDVGGGWYLRGDVGVSHYEAHRLENASSPGISYYDRDFGSGGFAGAGVGYQFNSWFRADVTGEYRFSTGFGWRDKGGANTSTQFYNPGTGVYDTYTATGTSYEKTKSSYYAAVVLVNGYFDLGTWYGFTPFLGGGVGYAYHFFRGGDTSTVNAYGNYVDVNGVASPGGPPAGVSGGSIANKDKGDLAWALHAGVAYDVTPNVKLELAYRYLNMGDVKTGVINCYCNQQYAGTRIRELESHDVKIGMRWAFGGPVSAPAYEPGPLIRKY